MSVSSPAARELSARGRCLANSLIRRRVTVGASSASPAAMTRTAWKSCSAVTSLSRKPLAPAHSASYTYSSRSKVVRMTMRGRSEPGLASCRVASMPSTPGIRTSIRTTSGAVSVQTRTASDPSSAVPTTVKSGCVPSSAVNPLRTI